MRNLLLVLFTPICVSLLTGCAHHTYLMKGCMKVIDNEEYSNCKELVKELD